MNDKGWFKRWPYFGPDEVLSPDGLALYKDKGIILIQQHALDALCNLRQLLNIPIKVNHAGLKFRGFRSFEENRAVGGATNSMHQYGIAFDCTPIGMSLENFKHAAVAFGFTGVGYYPKKNFVHLDLRNSLLAEPFTWRG